MQEFLSTVVGNRDLCRRLGNDILAGTMPHAVILEGHRGTGKHTLAYMLAAALVCEKKGDPSLPLPCLACPACRKMSEGKSPDLIRLGCDGKASVGVDTVRFLCEDVHVIPNDGEHKIYILEDADKMTVQAQNALLLTLEEPPSYVHFFLLCENAGLLLETIRSRAPVLRTEPLSVEEIDRYLCEHDRRAAQMKVSKPKEYAELLLASGHGIGQAMEYLEPKCWQPVYQRRGLATDFMATAVRQEGAKAVLPLLSRFSSKREVLKEQLQTTSDAARDLILLKKSEEAPLSFYVDREEAIELCDRVPLPFLYELNQALRTALQENAGNANVRLCLLKMAISAHLI